MISISTLTGNVNGNVLIRTYQDFRTNEARLSRVKTLDGGVVMTHNGTTDSDRSIDVQSKLSESDCAKLWTIFNSETFVYVSTENGLFIAAIGTLKINKGAIILKILINNKES